MSEPTIVHKANKRTKLNWAINGRFATQQVTGVQRYAIEIVTCIDQLVSENADLGRLKFDLILPNFANVDSLPLSSIRPVHTRIGSGHLWDQFVLPFYAGDGVLSLGNFGPMASRNHVVCIHDANTFIAPESYSRVFGATYRTLLPLIGRRARRVATVSNFSASMLAQYKICNAEKIFVAPNGHEHVLRWDARLAKLPLLQDQTRPFILLLGSQAKHKNIDVILANAQAFDAAGLDIIVVGAASKIFSDDTTIVRSPNVKFTGYVGDNELAALYSNALCLAFPSKTEGFGVPPLEAMTSGCPVISSNAASLPEVGGDAMLYVDPTNRRGWLDTIVGLSQNSDLRASLQERGFTRAKTFSWKKSAGVYLEEILRLMPYA